MTNAQESSDDEMSQCDDEASEPENKEKSSKKSSGVKRAAKAEDKKDKLEQKLTSGSKKLDEMKARINKKAEKKPAVPKSDKEQSVTAKPKLLIKSKKLPDKKEEVAEKSVPTGIAGGVKIGGGLKSKLISLKKPTATIPSTKKEETVAEVKESDNVEDN